MQNYLIEADLFGYEIFFENETNATAPAQIVQISDPLSTNLDWTTFQLGEIDFGNQYIRIAPNQQYFQTNIPMSYNGVSFTVQISAGIQLATGQVYADFYSINPATQLPPPAGVGFLPPEDGTGRGIGHVLYTVRPKPNLPTGLQISNVAYIQFDQNAVIATDQINTNDLALVTIDSTPPVSSVLSLPAIETNANFTVCWSGTDVGPGIAGYNIYVATNSGPWTEWRAGTTNTCVTFTALYGGNYGFYSVAYDGAGNTQAAPASAQASTFVRLTTVTWTNPAPIIYGTPLGSTQLNATANVAGNFAYTPTNGSILSAGTNTLSVIFTPTDTVDYNSATNMVSLVVSPAPLTIASGLTANSKFYDRTTNATLSSNNVAFSGVVSGDTVYLNTNGYVASFASAGVGNGIGVSVSGLTLSGASAGNYTLTQPGSLTANINPAPVTVVSGLTANSKVYNRTTTTTLSSNNVTLSGIVVGDTLSLNTNGYVANFASAGVGNGIAVIVTGLTLAGASNADYTLAQPATLTANITAAPVTITSGITANNKVYSGTTTATLSSNTVVLSGVVNGDTLSLNTNGYAANFASAGVGNGIAVSVTGLTLAGASNADYTLAQPGSLTANITAAPVTITSGITANNKVYNGTTTATLSSNTVVLADVVNGDTLSLNTNGYVANFASAGVGNGIAVSVTGLSLSGASNADYTLTQPAGLTANIIAPGVQIFANLPNIVISWTTNATVFVLCQTPSLTPPATWSPVTNTITVNGTNNTIIIHDSSTVQYFELIGPP